VNKDEYSSLILFGGSFLCADDMAEQEQELEIAENMVEDAPAADVGGDLSSESGSDGGATTPSSAQLVALATLGARLGNPEPQELATLNGND